MLKFDTYLRNIDIKIIKDKIQSEWDIIPENNTTINHKVMNSFLQIQLSLTTIFLNHPFQIIQTQQEDINSEELLASFIDIIKLYLIQDTNNNNNDSNIKQDSLVHFFLSYVFQCANKGNILAWRMIEQLERQSHYNEELKLILFLLEQDNKRSFCNFYFRTRNIIIEYLQGYESDFILLDTLSVSIDQWSEISRRIFPTNLDDIIKKIAKVITSDHQDQQTFDPSLKLSCGRLIQIYLWIYFKQINQYIEDQKKYENQSELRRQQREQNKIQDTFYQWSKPLFQNNHFQDNIKYIEAIKINKAYKQKFPKQSTNKIYNASPPKQKKYMPHLNNNHNNINHYYYSSDSKINMTSQIYSPIKTNRGSQQIQQSMSLQQSPQIQSISKEQQINQVNSYTSIPRYSKEIGLIHLTKQGGDYTMNNTMKRESQIKQNGSNDKQQNTISPKKESYLSQLLKKTTPTMQQYQNQNGFQVQPFDYNSSLNHL